MALVDHSRETERRAKELQIRSQLPDAFGQFLSKLTVWDWFVNPITFRDEVQCPDAAMKRIEQWLADIEAHAGNPIGWVIPEEFGALGGRWHCHGLISGTAHLKRRFWWAEAFRRFGRTRIEPFDPARAAAFYAAKYAAKALGKIHFGGRLAGVELSHVVRPGGSRRSWADSHTKSSESSRTHAVISPSANIEKDFFRLSLKNWHR